MCRAPSRFITPSSNFYKQGEQGKEQVMTHYRESMKRVPCRQVYPVICLPFCLSRFGRYFQKSLSSTPFCPFGKDCFYLHANTDGSEHVFTDGVDECMKVRRYVILFSSRHIIDDSSWQQRSSHPADLHPDIITSILPPPILATRSLLPTKRREFCSLSESIPKLSELFSDWLELILMIPTTTKLLQIPWKYWLVILLFLYR